MKKSPRGKSKNILTSNTWPSLPSEQKNTQKSKPPRHPIVAAQSEQKNTQKSNQPDQKQHIPEHSNIARAYICVPADQPSDIDTLTKKVAELEVSYNNLMEMYNTQIKINNALLNNISTLAAYGLMSICRRSNNFASALPRMIQSNDKSDVFKREEPLTILCIDDGSIISSMIDCDMHKPLIDVIFTYTHVSKIIHNGDRFLENSKLIIERTPWNLLVNASGLHILAALKCRSNTRTSDQEIWRALYEFALSKQPKSEINRQSRGRKT